jgi:hypothetical protein
MKSSLIQKWLELNRLRGCLATAVFEKERKQKARIERILWQRYRYDIENIASFLPHINS